MEHVRDLALIDASIGMDPSTFMSGASAMIAKTHRLVHLTLLPNSKKIEWIAILAENAAKLSHLHSLTISSEFPLELPPPDEVARRPS